MYRRFPPNFERAVEGQSLCASLLLCFWVFTDKKNSNSSFFLYSSSFSEIFYTFVLRI